MPWEKQSEKRWRLKYGMHVRLDLEVLDPPETGSMEHADGTVERRTNTHRCGIYVGPGPEQRPICRLLLECPTLDDAQRQSLSYAAGEFRRITKGLEGMTRRREREWNTPEEKALKKDLVETKKRLKAAEELLRALKALHATGEMPEGYAVDNDGDIYPTS